MKDTLETLFYGGIYPAEQFLPRQEEYSALRKKLQERYQKLCGKLDADLRREFDVLIEEQLDAYAMENMEMFIGGYRLGAKLTIEVFMDDDEKTEKNENEA